VAIQDKLRVFHDYADCRGIIVSTDQGGETTLKCAECGKKVGKLDAGLLNQLIEQIPKPKEPSDERSNRW
jgi:hypothetical protein